MQDKGNGLGGGSEKWDTLSRFSCLSPPEDFVGFILIDPPPVQIFSLSSLLRGGVFRPSTWHDYIPLALSAAQLGITWRLTKCHPVRTLKLVSHVWSEWWEMIYFQIFRLKWKWTIAPALCFSTCLHCFWHSSISKYHNDLLFKVVWHSNLCVWVFSDVCAWSV